MTTVECSNFGNTKDNKEVLIYKISTNKCSVDVINYGATIVSLKVPDKNGDFDDIVTGFHGMQGYYERSRFFGCVVGRFGNRIAKGKFTLDEKEYSLAINNGPNALHGGLEGFDKRLWSSVKVDNGVQLTLVSPDGDQGYPGELTLVVTYILQGSELLVQYKATTSKATIINITNHSYFNLGGHKNWGNLSKHEIEIRADHYLPADDKCLVTGEIRKVEGSEFDLRKPTMLTEELLESVSGGGYDHTFCLPRQKQMARAITLRHTGNGREMSVSTDAPGVQFYTSNFLSGQEGKLGVKYDRHTALCLETQNWPDAINHVGNFPNCVLRPGEEYAHNTTFSFSTF